MTSTSLASASLDDKYLKEGRVLLSGRQALVRLPMLQRALDRRDGLHTAGFISGYRGSPLGGYDSELWKARQLLEQSDIIFQPGVNEDLAATAVWGTQQLGFIAGRKCDGVFAIWYGKGPGVDRSGDAIKHANMQGVEPHGGVLMVFGDDHAGKSSSIAHQSDLALAAHDVPILYPASVAEILDYGLAGFALSRFSGLWVGLKVVNETAEATSVVDVQSDVRFIRPHVERSASDVHIRKEFLAVLQQDARIVRQKLPLAQAFVRANRLDRIAFGASDPRFLIATAGKAYGDVCSALALLGIDEAAARSLGLGVYKLALIHPVEPEGLREAAAAAQEIFCVEEKRAQIERQVAALLFNAPGRPRLSGKTDPNGAFLLPADVPLDALTVAAALSRRLVAAIPDLEAALPAFMERSRKVAERVARNTAQPALLSRRPSFCAGCPHSSSTKVPEGSIGMTGIGCHSMAMFLPDRNPLPVTHMGGEGAAWLGLSNFTKTKHVFQNLGDGTYNHSGSLAIRAAVQARINITYKILYNDAVAMTGGQPIEGGLTVERIAAQVMAEGVRRVAIVSDQPERFASAGTVPAGTTVHHRDDLDTVQRSLREVEGVSILIYDQTCAAEKRRRRKRGQYPDPDRRVFINHRVCEGCGDCSDQSNCMAIQPLETELGRKRRIDQSACNKDFSCTKGFCPSFVTIEHGRLRRPNTRRALADLPLPPDPVIGPLGFGVNILLAGIGGTGIVTVSSILGMAAYLDGYSPSLYDMTGLSQKGGTVFSHIRLSPRPAETAPVRIGSGETDLLLACDAVAATHPEALQSLDASRSTVILNGDVAATADFHQKPDLAINVDLLAAELHRAAGQPPVVVPADRLAMRFFGDSVASNMIMLGVAWQAGKIPLTWAAIERAIELNGVAVAANLMAVRLGRIAAATPAPVLLGGAEPARPANDLDDFVARRIADLTAYWNAGYADIYAAAVSKARAAEAALKIDSDAFAWSVARSAFKLMAYKDEYEVARLYADGEFKRALDEQFEGSYRLAIHLAPPLLARRDKHSGRPRKTTFGPWMLHLFPLLAKLKHVRETPLDIFGYTSERRIERQLRDAYLRWVDKRCADLTPDQHAAAVALAAAPQAVRGFGIVKHNAAQALLARIAAEGIIT